MATWTSRDENKNQYYQRVRALAKQLQHVHKVFLVSIPHIGYRTLEHGKEIEKCKAIRDRGMRGIFKAWLDTRDIPIERFSDPAAVTKAVTEQNKMATLNAMLINGMEEKRENVIQNKSIPFQRKMDFKQ